MAQLVKISAFNAGYLDLSHGWEDPLEKGKAALSSILAWRIPWGRKELDTTEQLLLSLSFLSLFSPFIHSCIYSILSLHTMPGPVLDPRIH